MCDAKELNFYYLLEFSLCKMMLYKQAFRNKPIQKNKECQVFKQCLNFLPNFRLSSLTSHIHRQVANLLAEAGSRFLDYFKQGFHRV